MRLCAGLRGLLFLIGIEFGHMWCNVGNEKKSTYAAPPPRLVPEPSTRATPHKFSAPVANQFLTCAV